MGQCPRACRSCRSRSTTSLPNEAGVFSTVGSAREHWASETFERSREPTAEARDLGGKARVTARPSLRRREVHRGVGSIDGRRFGSRVLGSPFTRHRPRMILGLMGSSRTRWLDRRRHRGATWSVRGARCRVLIREDNARTERRAALHRSGSGVVKRAIHPRTTIGEWWDQPGDRLVQVSRHPSKRRSSREPRNSCHATWVLVSRFEEQTSVVRIVVASFAAGSRSAGCKPRGIDPPRARASHGRNPLPIVERQRWRGGSSWRIGPVSVRSMGSNPRTQPRSSRMVRRRIVSSRMQHDGRRSGTLNRELLTELVGMLPGALGQHEGARFSQDNGRACSGRWSIGTTRACPAHDMERQRSESSRERLVQHLVRCAAGREAAEPSTSNWKPQALVTFHRCDVDRSGRQRTAASLASSLERELEGRE